MVEVDGKLYTREKRRVWDGRWYPFGVSVLVPVPDFVVKMTASADALKRAFEEVAKGLPKPDPKMSRKERW
jgi:hypothetical protein